MRERQSFPEHLCTDTAPGFGSHLVPPAVSHCTMLRVPHCHHRETAAENGQNSVHGRGGEHGSQMKPRAVAAP